MNDLTALIDGTRPSECESAAEMPPEVSVVMPCLNEAETLAACIRKAFRSFQIHGIRGEVVVADNGSSDASREIAAGLGARVVDVAQKGYGNALQGGILAASGTYIIMGDADDSYDFTMIYPFVDRLRHGAELVMGNRFRGGILPGAMPWKHRWIGNPVLSGLGRLLFRCPVGDFHCGLRGFTKEAFLKMRLQTTGMEFASEMVIKATLLRLSIDEVPTVLHPDGRSRPPHLRSWRDGWRHLRFMLLFSPRWLFLLPGVLIFLVGLVTGLRLWFGPVQIGRATFDIHTMLVAGAACMLGFQLVVFALFTKIFVVVEGLHPSTRLSRYRRDQGLEMGVAAGLLVFLCGAALLLTAARAWWALGFEELDPRVTMRQVIPAVVLLMLGLQTVFSSFFLGVLTLRRKTNPL